MTKRLIVKLTKIIAATVVCAGSLCWLSPRACAQDDGPPPPPPEAAPAAPAAAPGGGPGGPGGADRMEQFRQRMNERIKGALQANDQEWAVIQPLLNKVQDKMRETMVGRFAGAPRPPRDNARADNAGDRPERANRPDRPEQAGSAEAQALRATLENSSSSNTEIKAKLEALRQSRQKAVADLEQARTELKGVLSLHQEATLVMMGMLD